jgi:transcriptional regulator with XRE-family HTH domain
MLSVAEYLKERRTYLKLKQKDLADIVGVTSAHINRIEGGLTKASPGFLQKVAEALGLDVVNLYILSLEERNLPEALMTELREMNSIRPLLKPGMPLKRFHQLTQSLSPEQIDSLLVILEIFVGLIANSVTTKFDN